MLVKGNACWQAADSRGAGAGAPGRHQVLPLHADVRHADGLLPLPLPHLPLQRAQQCQAPSRPPSHPALHQGGHPAVDWQLGFRSHRVHIGLRRNTASVSALWSVHCNFVCDGFRVKGCGRAPSSLTRQGWFFHHEGMYARNRQLPLCVYSVLETSCSDPWYDQWANYVHNKPHVNEWQWVIIHNDLLRTQPYAMYACVRKVHSVTSTLCCTWG